MSVNISVIIPAYNAEKFIKETIESIKLQTYPVFEIIVIDDGSQDKTVEIVEHNFLDVIIIQQKNAGVSSARNTGIKHSKGNYICFLDADDLWHPAKIEKQVATLKQFPKAQFILTDECLFDVSGIYCNSVLSKTSFCHELKAGTAHFDHALKYLLTESFVSTSSVLASKKLIASAGCFSEDLSIGEDREYWIKLALLSTPILINEPLVRKRENHGNNLSHISQIKWARGLSQVISSFDTQLIDERLQTEGVNSKSIFARNYSQFGEIFWNEELYDEARQNFKKARKNGAPLNTKMLASAVLPTKIIRMLRK